MKATSPSLKSQSNFTTHFPSFSRKIKLKDIKTPKKGKKPFIKIRLDPEIFACESLAKLPIGRDNVP